MDEPREQSELLSAYLDGEVTEAERAEVEGLLEQSPDARSELEDFKHLAAMLRELPHHDAPADLASSVTEEVGRRAGQDVLATAPLVAATAAAPSTATSVARSAKLRPARWVGLATVAGGLLAICLTVMVFAPGGAERDIPLAREDRSLIPQSSQPSFESAEAPESGPAPSASMMRSMAFENDELAPAPEPSAAMSADAVASDAAGDAPPERPPSLSATPFVATEGLVDGFGVPEEIGTTSTYLDSSGNELQIVYVTVLDVEEAVGTFNTLLAKNSVPLIDAQADFAPNATDDKARDFNNPARDRRSQEQLAVYVESTEDRLKQALSEADMNKLFLSWDARFNRVTGANPQRSEEVLRELARQSRILDQIIRNNGSSPRGQSGRPLAGSSGLSATSELSDRGSKSEDAPEPKENELASASGAQLEADRGHDLKASKADANAAELRESVEQRPWHWRMREQK